MATTPVSNNIVIKDYSITSTNVQQMFASLQLAMSKGSRKKAQEYIDIISTNQENAKTCAAWIDKARQLQLEAKNKGGTTEMPYEMSQYFKKMKISYAKTPDEKAFLAKHPEALDVFMADNTADQWEYNIKSLQAHQESVGSDTQQNMVFVQDFMGQYNSYLTGANSAFQQYNQSLLSIARS
jgi:hypothetical protein